MPDSWILAVDFGTTNTAAAIRFADGRVEKVKLDPSSDTMPSAVVLADGHWRVGQAALNARWTHPETFVGSPKARLGQEPMVLGGALVAPAQIAALVLATVRDRAVRAAGGGAPDRLVLTHPVRWGQARLDALREAARLAGFPTDSIRLLPEPIAALHAYVPSGSLQPGSRVVVVDTGGGTCDIAVLHVTDDPTPGKDLLVVAQEGDDRLGGNDLDDLLYQWVLSQLNASGRTDMVAALQDPAHLDAAMTLVDMVRAAKQELSEHTDAPLAVAVAGQKTTLTVTRDEYEKLIAEPVARAANLTARALSVSGTTRLTGLYLTGGTAYTPALARALHQVTGILTAPISDPKMVVAVGALRTPTAVMNPVELHQLTQELAARRLQQAQPATHRPGPQPAVGAAGPVVVAHQPPPRPVPPASGAEPTSPGLPSPPGPESAAQPPLKGSSPSRRTKVLAGVLAGVLVVGAAVGLWLSRSDADPEARSTSPSPDKSPVAVAATCWDGSNGKCTEFSGADAVKYAFAPPDPAKCASWGFMDVETGRYYEEECAEEKPYKPYKAELVLWADMDAIKFDMTDNKYQAAGTWDNGDGDTVGTRYTPLSTGGQIIYCYDKIPTCLKVYEMYEEATWEQFGTLSTDQVRDLSTWLDTHPVPDPTAGWDPKDGERAFPAADGADQLKCSMGRNIPPTGADKLFTCEWPDGALASVIVLPTTTDAQSYYKDKVAEPWVVGGVEHGTVFTDEQMVNGNEKRWCYAEAPYCLKINMTNPDEYIGRIAPLTEEQAANL